MDIKKYIASIPGYPKEGVIFRDVTPLLDNPDAMQEVCQQLGDFAKEIQADVVISPEARGFFFGLPVAMKEKLGFAPVRKPGKLPRETISETYSLEYGTDELCMHADSIQPGQRVVIIDDLLATGGTVGAAARMVERMGGVVAGYAFVIELDDLKGRAFLEKGINAPVLSIVHYEGE